MNPEASRSSGRVARCAIELRSDPLGSHALVFNPSDPRQDFHVVN